MPKPDTEWTSIELSGGRYLVETILGEGGMGSVYKARDRNLDTDVVIKVPLRSMLANREFAERFKREIRSLVRLSHPHIVKVLDVGEYDEMPFAVMQYLSGGSLEDRRPALGGGRFRGLPLEDLRKWLADVAAALDFVHRQGYVHRDVKPANILFDSHQNAYLSDFGVARVVAESESESAKSLTGTGLVLGTPRYMAPELVMGEAYDGRIDQYALAVSVHEVLIGAPPIDAPTAAALLVQQTIKPPPYLSALDPRIPPAFADAVLRALSKDPKLRYPTCADFAAALLSALPSGGTRSAPASPYGRTSNAENGKVRCPSCNAGMRLSDPARNKILPCPKCGVSLLVADDLGGITEVLEQSAGAMVDTASSARLTATVVFAPPPGVAPSPAGPPPHAVAIPLVAAPAADVPIASPAAGVAPMKAMPSRRRLLTAACISVVVAGLGVAALRTFMPPPNDARVASPATTAPAPTGGQPESPTPRATAYADNMPVPDSDRTLGFSATTPPKPVNRPPVVTIDSFSVKQPTFGKPVTIRFRAVDPEDDPRKVEYRFETGATWLEATDDALVIERYGAQHRTFEYRAVDNLGHFSSGQSFQFDDSPPTCEFQVADVAKPVLGGTVPFDLSGVDPEGSTIRFEFRIGGSGLWRETPNRYELVDLRPEQRFIEFRSTDEVGGRSPARRWDLPNFPPTIEIASHVPQQPRLGVPLVVNLVGVDPEKRPLKLQWRRIGGADWITCSRDQVVLPALADPKIELEVRSLDAGDLTSPVKSLSLRAESLVTEITSPKTEMKFVLIPHGSFRQEDPPEDVAILSAFYLGVFEVTQGEYLKVTGTNPSPTNFAKLRDDAPPATRGAGATRLPVQQVSWIDAIRFCNRLSVMDGLPPYYSDDGAELEGIGYRLPTEQEWEYACRAGTTTKWSFGDEFEKRLPTGRFEQMARFKTLNSGSSGPDVVGSYPPNAFGLYDMHGNVWEHCSTEFGSGSGTTRRVIRGGGFNREPSWGLSGHRGFWDQADGESTFGFRVAKSVFPNKPPAADPVASSPSPSGAGPFQLK